MDGLAADAEMRLDSIKANPVDGCGMGVRFVFHAAILAMQNYLRNSQKMACL